MGDFNTTLNPEIDRTPGSTSNNLSATEIIIRYMEDTLMTDIWRDRNMATNQFTYFKCNPKLTCSRIDFFLIDMSIAAWCTKTTILPGFKSDHSAVLLELNVLNVVKGQGLWKLNSQVLYEMDYVKLINQTIENSERLSQGKTSAEKRELLKLNIIANSQAYCQERAANRKLKEVIQRFEQKGVDKLSVTEVNIYNRTKTDYQMFLDEKTKGAMLRSGAQYFTEGEKPTKYFLGLEKAKSGSKGMSCILKDNGDVICDTKLILKEQVQFYSKLYRSDTSVNFTYKNESNIKLDNSQAMELEGEISMQELEKAIKQLNRNSAPGADGLMTVFYVVFWTRIKELLLEAINECYHDKALFLSAQRGVITLIPKKVTIAEL